MEIKMTQKIATIAESGLVMNPAQRLLTHTVRIADPASVSATLVNGKKTVLLRQVIGEELRRRRNEQSRTLRDVSRDAQVSLGYLSELERGQKEASSELLAAVCSALDTPLSSLLAGVSTEVARREAMLADRASFSIA
jgi:hypothetical protein